MKIFIAWSKGLSRKIGLSLKNWLLEVHRGGFTPFISDEDIGVGARWHDALDSALKSADFGVLCVTEENLSSPWLLYESGVLGVSTAINDKINAASHVAPILFGNVKASQLASPLGHFQSIPFEKGKMLDFALQLNAYSRFVNPNARNPLDAKDIEANFERAYPVLEQKVQVALATPNALQTHTGDTAERLEGILTDWGAASGGDHVRNLEAFDALLAEFHCNNADEKLSKLGNILSREVHKNGFTAEILNMAREYQNLLQKYQDLSQRGQTAPPLQPSASAPAPPGKPNPALPDNVELFRRKLKEIESLCAHQEIRDIHYEGGLLLEQFDPSRQQDARPSERRAYLGRFLKMLEERIRELESSTAPGSSVQWMERLRAMKELKAIAEELP